MGAIVDGVGMRHAAVVVVTVLGVASVSAAAAFAHTDGACRVPRLTGLTLAVARARVAHAGCRLRVSGPTRDDRATQTVERQWPDARAHSSNVIVWLKPIAVRKNDGPLDGHAAPVAPSPPKSDPSTPPPPIGTCAEEGLPVSGSRTHGQELEGPFGSPYVTPGPTELVSGVFLEGGPPPPPGCEWPALIPGPGTLQVMNASGEVVASQTSEEGHFVEIPLPPGTYTIMSAAVSATFCEGAGSDDCTHPTETYEVTITAGYTVRKDFVVQIP